MISISLEALRAESGGFDDAVARTPGIDRFCSSSAWVLSAHEALMGAREPWILRIGGGAGWAATAVAERSGGRFVEPLELSWGLASALIGEDAEGLGEAFVAAAAARADWDGLLLAGMAPGGVLERGLVRALPGRWRFGPGAETARMLARLDAGGMDGWLGRRSRNFRKALRAAERDCARDGVTFEEVVARDAASADAAMARVLDVERRSWKGQAGVGVDDGPMRAFYAHMVRLLAPAARMRLIMARAADRDIGFILGGVFAGEYRGLQFSHDVTYRHLSLGNVLQRQQIERLCAEGVGVYDLGTVMEYKERWADEAFVTRLLVVLR